MRPISRTTERRLALGTAGAVGLGLTYLAFRAAGPAAGAPALAATVAGLTILGRLEGDSRDRAAMGQAMTAALLALPAVLLVYLSFNAGGFYPRTQAVVALALVLVLVLRVTLADKPFAGVGWPVALATAALSLYSLWILCSIAWSDVPGRGLLEFNRALTYLLALVVFGSLGGSGFRLSWMLRAIALAMTIVSVGGLLTRLFPDVLETAPNILNERLSYPLTYWNALGILAVIATILAIHLTSSLREPAAVRVLAAASVPALVVAVFFTFSRGPIVAGVVGLGLYVVLGRPHALLGGAIAVLPPSVVALLAAYDAPLLATSRTTAEASIEQGHRVGLVLGLCVCGAAIIRTVLVRYDRRLAGYRLPRRSRTPIKVGAGAVLATAAVAISLALDVPGVVSAKYDGFRNTGIESQESDDDFRTRLTDPGSSGRIETWDVALQGFRDHPLRGAGAGTYSQMWFRDRPEEAAALSVQDAHSLYLENLAELGLIGTALLAVVLVVMLTFTVPVGRRDKRSSYAAVFAALVAWAIHAGVDWDWEMPAVTLWLFAVGGLALAERKRGGKAFSLPRGGRVGLGLFLMLLAVAPAAVLVSDVRLERAVAAYERDDCAGAVEAAEGSIAALSTRHEPYEVLGLCQARRRYYGLAIDALREAIERDPHRWELHYDLALVRASAALEPRGAALTALRLNPEEPLTRQLVSYLGRSTRVEWRRELSPVVDRLNLTLVR